MKVTLLLLVLKGGYTKFPCFVYLWDNRANEFHYKQKECPEKTKFNPGFHNITGVPLVDKERVLLLPFHIKLGLIRNFVKALNQEGDDFKYLPLRFRCISKPKLKSGIFVFPQIRELLKDKNAASRLDPVEKQVWGGLKSVVLNFLGNNKSGDYANHIENMIQNFGELGIRKIHFQNSHLDHFRVNLGSFREGQGEWILGIKVVEMQI